jgi:hypothetical protein
MAHFVRAAWSLKATPQSKTHLTASPLASKAPMVLTYCGILADGASIVYRMSTHLTGTDKNCKRCVAIAEKAPEVHASPLVTSKDSDAALSQVNQLLLAGEITTAEHAEAVLGIAGLCDAGAAADLLEEAKNVPAQLTPSVAVLPPMSWEAVRQTGAFAVALDIARQERNSEIRKNQARAALDAAKTDEDEALDLFRGALAAYRNDNNVLWGAARILATLVDNDDELGALQALRNVLDAQDGHVTV